MEGNASIFIAAGITVGVSILGVAISLGLLGKSAMEALGRNPAAQKTIMTPMYVFLGVIEALSIYALVMAFVILGNVK